MITEDRRQLNNRFKQVFRILEDRGDIIKNDRNGKGLGDFAKKVLGNRSYGHIIRAYLNDDDKRCINYEQARRVCHLYGVKGCRRKEGTGTPFGMDLPKASQEDVEENPLNIMLTTKEAFAGATVDTDSFVQESIDFFALPGLKGDEYVAFPISGNSMEPVIKAGDLVVCRPISGPHEIRDNKIYAVKHNGSVWIKYVQRVEQRGRTMGLRLISANFLEHDPWVEEVNEYTRIYEVVKRVSDL
ncbi:MAG: S24 family peptidase [Bacteroidota bacterium]